MQLECQRLTRRIVDLVGEQQEGLVCTSQDVRNLFVARCDPRARIDDEQNEVGLGDGLARLVRDRPRHRRSVGDVDAAGVNDEETFAVPVRDDLFAVARHAGRGVHDRRARARHAIDEGRLAHVRIADDRDGAEQRLRFAHVTAVGSRHAAGRAPAF